MFRFDQARWLVALPLTAVSGLGFVRATNVTDRPVCQMASEWVAARQGNLPSTFDEIRKYPTLYQRTIYGNLAPAQRTNIWQEKLNQLIAPNSGLTEQQREVVATIVNRLDVYTPDPNGLLNAIETQEDGVADQIHSVFDGAAAHRLFGALDMSADTSMEANSRAGLIKQTGIAGHLDAFAGAISRVLGHEPAKAAFSTCSCNTQEGGFAGCPFGHLCQLPHGGDDCTPTPIPSCGEFGDAPCDGLCY